MRVDLVGVPTVVGPGGRRAGAELGGRRAHVALAALALSGGPLTAAALADLVWRGAPPDTWPVALRGVVRGLRTTAASVSDQDLVTTVPGGYRLADGVEVDLFAADAALHAVEELLESGRHPDALALLAPLTGLRGADLLAAEDEPWLATHRARVDEVARRARALTVRAARGAGDPSRAVAAARAWVAAAPLDEVGHRALIESLEAVGDRAGVVRAFEQCRALLSDELGLDPSPETIVAYQNALGEPTAGRRAAVPLSATSFLARPTETEALRQAAGAPGVVTILGRGGVGKSRLAAEVLGRDASRVTYWCSVEAVGEEELLPMAVAFALDVDPGADPAGSIAAHLTPLGPSVVVLDGAEVARDGSAALAAELADRCPQLTVLVTSRVPLGLARERTVRVDPWPLPGPDEVTPEAPVVRLLVERVAERGGRLGPAQATGDLLRPVLERCAGLPLAIELVAAQLAVTSPGDLADQLAEFLDTASDPVEAMARSAYAALSGEEAGLFRRFGILEGDVPLWLARELVTDAGLARARVLRLLGALASYGLVRENRAGDRSRWSQDDELRRYARELLATAEEERAAYDGLAGALRARLPDDPRSPPGQYAGALTEVLPSVRSLFGAAATGRAGVEPSLELAFRLHRYWASTSVGEGRYWLGRLLDTAPAESRWEPYATYALGYLEYWSGDGDRATERLRRAADLLRGVDDRYVARALVFLAGLFDDADRPAEAVATIREAMAIVEDLEPEIQMPAVMGLGSLLSERGDPAAVEPAVRAVELCRDPARIEQLTIALPTAAMICWQVGAVEQAQRFIDEALPLHDEARISRVVLRSAAAGLALDRGDPVAAAELAEAADVEGTELGVERELPLVRCLLARAWLAQGDLAGAATATASALEAALAMAHDFPLALGLETAALVLAELGGEVAGERGPLVVTARQLRARGDRPAPAGLALPDTSVAGTDDAGQPRSAARRAIELLTG